MLFVTGTIILLFGLTAVFPSSSTHPVSAGGSPAVYLPIITSSLGNGHINYPVVFVSRQIPDEGSIYWSVPGGMVGVGPYSRFQVARPGKLLILEPNGMLRTLIDGSDPTPQSLNLIDVNAPDVSYDGTEIVFAGFRAGDYHPDDRLPTRNPGGWRIYAIHVDGTNLRQITTSDLDYDALDMSQFEGAANVFRVYDDTDPVWLPDGRVAFSSTRWPAMAHYSGVRTSNLYVMEADGGNMRRITSERNGADRPLVDPLTGKITFSRWWRNHRFASNDMNTIPEPNGGYIQHLGLTTSRTGHVGGTDNLWRNSWQIAAINPDGTGLELWAAAFRNEIDNHYYGGAFTADGDLIANFFPMGNMTEAAGFGGLRRYHRGPGLYEPIIGITTLTLDYVNLSPPSFGIFQGNYAAEPEALPGGPLLISWAEGIAQDYGLYLVNEDGTDLTLLYDNPGTAELRARLVRARPLPPIIADTVTQTPGPLPPPAAGPYDTDGTFTFNALNVYFNAPVDADIVSAPPVGSAATITFFLDQQRTSNGSFPNRDWPILLETLPVNADGSVVQPNAPANVPLFEQLRGADGTVPLTTSPDGVDGAAHVAGMNYGRPGTSLTCVGCHAGHTMIPIPENQADAVWTNLAPGAEVTVSSSRNPDRDRGVVDRLQMKGEIWRIWSSASGQTQNQWVALTFPVPIAVRTVRLYNPRQESDSTIQVNGVTVRLYSDGAGTIEVASQTAGSLSVSGTNVNFADVTARVIRVEINSVSGRLFGMQVASLGEIEVIAKGEVP
jgi:hypothetical protein